MSIHKTRDGSKVEIVIADALSGPGDCFGQMHCNSNATWFRWSGMEWHSSRDRPHILAAIVDESESICGFARKLIERGCV